MTDQRDLWAFGIDWGSGFEEDISWRTAIIVSRDGTEQRIGQRVKPRYVYSFTNRLARGGLEEALLRVAEDQGREFLIPYPREMTRLAEDAPAASGTMTLTEVPSWLVDGTQAALMPSGMGTAELVDIASLAGSVATLSTPLLASFPAGSRLMQLRSGRSSRKIGIQAVTNTVAQAGVQFEADPLSTLAPVPGDPPATYAGRELWEQQPNWAGGVVHTFEQDKIDLDLDRGPVDAFFPVRYTGRNVQLQYLLRTSEQIDALLDLFHRSRGRQKTFYAPLWLSELRPRADLGGTSVIVSGRQLYDAFAESVMYRKLAVKTPSGFLYRTVSGITLSEGNTVLTLTEALPSIPLASLFWCGWLARCRFATDRLTLQWLTDGVARSTITLMTLEDS